MHRWFLFSFLLLIFKVEQLGQWAKHECQIFNNELFPMHRIRIQKTCFFIHGWFYDHLYVDFCWLWSQRKRGEDFGNVKWVFLWSLSFLFLDQRVSSRVWWFCWIWSFTILMLTCYKPKGPVRQDFPILWPKLQRPSPGRLSRLEFSPGMPWSWRGNGYPDREKEFPVFKIPWRWKKGLETGHFRRVVFLWWREYFKLRTHEVTFYHDNRLECKDPCFTVFSKVGILYRLS